MNQFVSLNSYLSEKLGLEIKNLNFRFPIETLSSLLKSFYKEYEHPAFLLQASPAFSKLSLKKIANSYLLQVPIKFGICEHLYIGLSDMFSFVVFFSEPNILSQGVVEKKSNFFLTFDQDIVSSIFDYFYKNYCSSLSNKEKRLLQKLKNVKTKVLNPFYVGKFHQAILISTIGDVHRVKNNKLLEALSFTDDLIVITNLSGEVQESNKKFQEKFRFKNIEDILSKKEFESIKYTIHKEGKWEKEIQQDTAYLVNCYLFKDELNRVSGYVFTFKDINNIKKLDKINRQLIDKLREKNIELSEVNRRLLQADKIKSDLLSILGHELKTPLATIIGFSELIYNRDYDASTLKSYAEQINISARNLEKLINDYLDVAYNQFGVSYTKVDVGEINLGKLIKDVYEDNACKFQSSYNLVLSVLGYEPTLVGEVANMKRLFGNLISNALKYSPEGGDIVVKILNDGEKVTVSISDEGIGISNEQAKSVFEPFYRVDNSVTRKFSGIGLGLAVCRKIVELYNGSIWCEPGEHKGTIFYVSLPVNFSKKVEIVESSNVDTHINAYKQNAETIK